MLRDQNEGCQRSMRRVSILLSLLDEDGEYTGVGSLLPARQPGLLVWTMNHPPAAAFCGSQKQLAPWESKCTSGISVDLACPKEMGLPSCWGGSGMQSLPLGARGCAECTSALLFHSRFLTGRQDAPLCPFKEARRELHLQREGLGGEGSLQSGRSAGSRHVQVLPCKETRAGCGVDAWLSQPRRRFFPNL